MSLVQYLGSQTASLGHTTRKESSKYEPRSFGHLGFCSFAEPCDITFQLLCETSVSVSSVWDTTQDAMPPACDSMGQIDDLCLRSCLVLDLRSPYDVPRGSSLRYLQDLYRNLVRARPPTVSQSTPTLRPPPPKIRKARIIL